MDNLELEFKYKEMVRLSEVLDQYSKSSFEDFKLLGAVGVLLAFQPASSLFDVKNDLFLVLGFLAILVIICFVGFYGLLKQSLAVFYLDEISKFEKEFREGLRNGESDLESFRVAENWKLVGSKKQREVAKTFYGVFYIVVVFFPTVVLCISTNYSQATVYFISAMIVSALHFRTAKNIHTHT
ncbi:hypothetical protein [uncultured Desulfobacter sp.]|uniref:hypothetical protein n=1 Tax=uncultured Desulfobacter sp. TaxID=240139 RepID=UPI0029F4F209|nr:hypothetical protein [uncultured Desulfobacter sp.]